MDDKNELQLEKTPLEEPPRPNTDDGNELQNGRTPLEEPLNRLSISRNKRIPTAFKLGNEGDNVPDHFKVLVNNTILDRWRLIQANHLNPSDFSLECDLLCCVALTIALEEGMRLNELHPTDGFDLRVFRELTNMPPFRMPNNTYKISLVLTRVPDQHFTMVLIPIGKDFCTLNFMAAGKNSKDDAIELSHPTSTGVPLSGHIEAIDKVTAKISNLRSLASMIRPVIYLVMQQVLADRKIALPNNLMGITEDTQTYIFKFLTVKEFLSMCEVNLYFHWFFRHHEWLWRYYMKRDFGKIIGYIDDWPEMRFGINKYKYLLTKSREKDVHVQTSSYWTNVPSIFGYNDGRVQTTVTGIPPRSISEVDGEPAAEEYGDDSTS